MNPQCVAREVNSKEKMATCLIGGPQWAARSVSCIYHHQRFKEGGRTQNVSYIFQGVFEGGLANVSLHFDGMLKTLPTKTTPWGRSATNFTFKGGPPKNVAYTSVWSPPEKWP